jgi:hypothetical protein
MGSGGTSLLNQVHAGPSDGTDSATAAAAARAAAAGVVAPQGAARAAHAHMLGLWCSPARILADTPCPASPPPSPKPPTRLAPPRPGATAVQVCVGRGRARGFGVASSLRRPRGLRFDASPMGSRCARAGARGHASVPSQTPPPPRGAGEAPPRLLCCKSNALLSGPLAFGGLGRSILAQQRVRGVQPPAASAGKRDGHGPSGLVTDN